MISPYLQVNLDDIAYAVFYNGHCYYGVFIETPEIINSKEVPTVMNFKLPSIFNAVHKKEYAATKDITVNANEVKALSKNLTKQLSKSLENLALKEREM